MGGLNTANAFNASGDVVSAGVAANSIGAGELNVSGNGSATQFLRSDADGSFTWAVPTDTNTTYSAGSGLGLSGTTFSHSDTSSQGSVNNSGSTFIQDITLDTYGHVTNINSATVSSGAPSGGAVGTILTMVGYNPGNVTLGSANPSVSGTSNNFSASSPLSARTPGNTGANWVTSNSAHSALTGTWRPTNDHARYGGNTFTYDTWIRVS